MKKIWTTATRRASMKLLLFAASALADFDWRIVLNALVKAVNCSIY